MLWHKFCPGEHTSSVRRRSTVHRRVFSYSVWSVSLCVWLTAGQRYFGMHVLSGARWLVRVSHVRVWQRQRQRRRQIFTAVICTLALGLWCVTVCACVSRCTGMCVRACTCVYVFWLVMCGKYWATYVLLCERICLVSFGRIWAHIPSIERTAWHVFSTKTPYIFFTLSYVSIHHTHSRTPEISQARLCNV